MLGERTSVGNAGVSVAGDGLEVGGGDARDLEVAGALAGLGEVVARLHRKSHTSIAIECCLDAACRLSGESARGRLDSPSCAAMLVTHISE